MFENIRRNFQPSFSFWKKNFVISSFPLSPHPCRVFLKYTDDKAWRVHTVPILLPQSPTSCWSGNDQHLDVVPGISTRPNWSISLASYDQTPEDNSLPRCGVCNVQIELNQNIYMYVIPSSSPCGVERHMCLPAHWQRGASFFLPNSKFLFFSTPRFGDVPFCSEECRNTAFQTVQNRQVQFRTN